MLRSSRHPKPFHGVATTIGAIQLGNRSDLNRSSSLFILDVCFLFLLLCSTLSTNNADTWSTPFSTLSLTSLTFLAHTSGCGFTSLSHLWAHQRTASSQRVSRVAQSFSPTAVFGALRVVCAPLCHFLLISAFLRRSSHATLKCLAHSLCSFGFRGIDCSLVSVYNGNT